VKRECFDGLFDGAHYDNLGTPIFVRKNMNEKEEKEQIKTQITRKVSLAVLMVIIVVGIPLLFNAGC